MAASTIRPRRRALLAGSGALLAASAVPCPGVAAATGVLRIHPDNPHVFLWRGRPRLLIGASEHFGAVINQDVDQDAYLDGIAQHGFTATRVFSGVLVEPYVGGNTLEPAGDRFLAPWARSNQPGNTKGGNRFDLTRFAPAYFERLRRYVAAASRRGIVVIYVLFSPHFDEGQWSVAPFNPKNNVNVVGVTRFEEYTLDRHGGLLPIQEALVRKVVDELRGADNVILELNYTRNRTLMSAEWERHMLERLFAEQRRVGNRSLVALNLGHGRAPEETIDPRVGVLTHNEANPDWIPRYARERRPFGLAETAFVPSSDREARFRAWDFVLSGTGLYLHTDFTYGGRDPGGRRLTKPDAQFGGGPVQRAQLGVLRALLDELPLAKTRPAPGLVTSPVPPALAVRAVEAPGECLVYVRPAPPPRAISMRWRGQLVPAVTGEHRFFSRSNDGVRARLGGELLFDDWTERGLVEAEATRRLEAGRALPLEVEYFYTGGAAEMRLDWQPPGGARAVIPVDALRDPSGVRRGLRAEHFAGRAFDELRGAREGQTVDFHARQPSPFAPPPFSGPLRLTLALAAGTYRLEWIDPASGGQLGHAAALAHGGGPLVVEAPPFADDVALRLRPGPTDHLTAYAPPA
jgi:hypothetical protein